MPRFFIYFLVLFSGIAALSWEVIWQIKASLALGVSAWGTAITLAVTMGGMSAGALLMGSLLRNKAPKQPLKLYGALEALIGLSGLCLLFSFKYIEHLDSIIYASSPDYSVMFYIVGIVAVLGVPTMSMGATLPVIGLISKQFKTSIAWLYGFNTVGAALGALLAAFLFIPSLGLQHSIYVLAGVNLSVAIISFLFKGEEEEPAVKEAEKQEHKINNQTAMPISILYVFVTGFATFMLEIAWFRSLTATFMSTTDAFAIMLSCVLLALGIGSWAIPVLKRRMTISLGAILVWSGALILIATPIIERLDLTMSVRSTDPASLFGMWFTVTFCIIGLPVLLLGMVLPSILDEQQTPKKWAFLYAFNAFAAILGAILAAWIFLPTVGFAKTAWTAGTIVVLAGMLSVAPRNQLMYGGLGIIALLIAITYETGVGRTRVQGIYHVPQSFISNTPTKVLKSFEGPDVTASAVEYENGDRILFIDGFVATQQPSSGEMLEHVHYMAWMGHMPMLMHPDPKNALVICFGTGQTANAVRKENPQSLDIVDINENIFKLAPYFPANENVLEDERVNAIVSDGRAHIRRTDKIYDVITLEPMPPTFAGVNALYSQEFYQLAKTKLGENGVIAQWLPFHLVPPYYGASIAKTFQSVFPNAILWIDPPSNVGILLGTVNENTDLSQHWPGLYREGIIRDLSAEEITGTKILYPSELELYGAHGTIITDDNQLLSYGKAAHALRQFNNFHDQNHELIDAAKK